MSGKIVPTMSDDDGALAPVIPLRSDSEELVALEEAVLDDLEERDAEYEGWPENTR